MWAVTDARNADEFKKQGDKFLGRATTIRDK